MPPTHGGEARSCRSALRAVICPRMPQGRPRCQAENLVRERSAERGDRPVYARSRTRHNALDAGPRLVMLFASERNRSVDHRVRPGLILRRGESACERRAVW